MGLGQRGGGRRVADDPKHKTAQTKTRRTHLSSDASDLSESLGEALVALVVEGLDAVTLRRVVTTDRLRTSTLRH